MTGGSKSTPTSGGYNFGTFAGVYIPALLTILGLVMFMRTNYVLGSVGLAQMLLILAIGGSITLATTLSIAAIATNTDIGAGGAYYLISRVLGPCFGTSIGLALFAAQSLAVPFNILGATEAIVESWPGLRPYFPWFNCGLGIMLFLLVWKGANWAVKAQFIIMGVLILSIFTFLLGPIGNFSLENLKANWGAIESVKSIVPFFAIFFPAITGIMAGVNMSGDLKSPHTSIPRGTLLALGSAMLIYLVQVVLAAGCFNREEMISAPYAILANNALFGLGFMIFIGVQAATLSTALGWLLGVPRVLQSLGIDNVLPGISFFKKGSGPNQEPRRAIVLVAIIVMPILFFTGQLGRNMTDTANSPINLMSQLVSLFFLFTYAIINLAALVESWGANPSFRPRFRFYKWPVAAYGACACIIVSFLINPHLSLVALVIITTLYVWTRFRNLSMQYGDARRGFIYSRIHSMMLQLMKLPSHAKNWRPTIVVLSSDPERRGRLIDYAILFSQRRGILSVIQFIISRDRREIGQRRNRQLQRLRQISEERNWPIFPAVVITPDFDDALRVLLQGHSLDPIRPNIVMLGWPHTTERVAPFFAHLQTIVLEFERNAVILANERSFMWPERADGGTIDIWWESAKGGSLMTILAYLVQLGRDWRKSELRILMHGDREDMRRIRHMLSAARIKAEVIRVPDGIDFKSGIARYSLDAELIFIEFPTFNTLDPVQQKKTHDFVRHDLFAVPPCFLVVSNGEADLLA